MISWLSKFITNAAKVLKPLTNLIAKSKSDVVKWGLEQQNAWDELLLIVCITFVRSIQ
jgi:hypothetical protein